jgi:hypothetical protein
MQNVASPWPKQELRGAALLDTALVLLGLVFEQRKCRNAAKARHRVMSPP